MYERKEICKDGVFYEFARSACGAVRLQQSAWALDDTSYNFSLTFSEGNRTVVPKDVYREVNDLEPTVIGDTVRQGFSAVSAVVPLIVLWMTRPYRIRICLWPGMEKGYVSLEDADVRTVIGSIRIK